MRFSLSTGSLYHFPLAKVFSLAKEVGFEGVELVIGPECALRGLNYVKGLIEEFQLPVLSLHPPMLRLPGWRGSRNTLLRSVEWANELGCNVVTFHPPAALSYEDDLWKIFVRAVGDSQSICTRRLEIAVENMVYLQGARSADRYVLDRHQELVDFVAAQGLAVTFDTSHAWVTEGEVLGPYRRFKDRLANIHLSDVNSLKLPTSMILLHSIIAQHQVPGTGLVPLRELLEEVCADEYQGLVTAEISPLSLRAWRTSTARKYLKQGLEFCCNIVPRG